MGNLGSFLLGEGETHTLPTPHVVLLEVTATELFNVPGYSEHVPIIDLCDPPALGLPSIPTAFRPHARDAEAIYAEIHAKYPQLQGQLCLYNLDGSRSELVSSFIELLLRQQLRSNDGGLQRGLCHRIMLLTGGLLAFRKVFPNLCQGFATYDNRIFHFPQQVRPHLFLGGQVCATNETVELLCIDAVLNAGAGGVSRPEKQGLHYLYLNFDDAEDVVLAPYLEQAVPFIHQYVQMKKNVLVHCQAGISRSVSCIVAYLMTVEPLTYEEALKSVIAVRMVAQPNDSFAQQLRELKVRDLRAAISQNVSIHEITAIELFNLPGYSEHVPIVDLRSLEDRRPPIPSAFQPSALDAEDVYTEIDEVCSRMRRGLCLYNSDGSRTGLLASFVQLILDTKPIGETRRRCTRILLLAGGLDAFISYFPRLCQRFAASKTGENRILSLPQLVRPHIFLGGQVCANTGTLEALCIDAVLNVGASKGLERPEKQGLDYLFLGFDDVEDVTLDPFIDEAVSFIHRHVMMRRNVLVHCHAGISRSVSCVIAYLMATDGSSYEEALDAVASVRMVAQPNDSFARQLKQFRIETLREAIERSIKEFYSFKSLT